MLPPSSRAFLAQRRLVRSHERTRPSSRNHRRRELGRVRSCDRSKRRCARKAREDGGNIQDQDNRSVAENGSAADQVTGDNFARKSFDHQFLFADQTIHEKTKTLLRGANNDNEMFLAKRLSVDAAPTAEVIQANESRSEEHTSE